jgi:hypothetical protein
MSGLIESILILAKVIDLRASNAGYREYQRKKEKGTTPMGHHILTFLKRFWHFTFLPLGPQKSDYRVIARSPA